MLGMGILLMFYDPFLTLKRICLFDELNINCSSQLAFFFTPSTSHFFGKSTQSFLCFIAVDWIIIFHLEVTIFLVLFKEILHGSFAFVDVVADVFDALHLWHGLQKVHHVQVRVPLVVTTVRVTTLTAISYDLGPWKLDKEVHNHYLSDCNWRIKESPWDIPIISGPLPRVDHRVTDNELVNHKKDWVNEQSRHVHLHRPLVHLHVWVLSELISGSAERIS